MKKGDREMPDKKIRFSKALLHPRYALSWIGLLAAALISVLPQKVRHFLGGLLGSYLYRNNEKRREVVLANLRQVYPEKSDKQLQVITKSHLKWYGKALLDYSLFFFGGRRRLRSLVTIDGDEILSELHKHKQPVILLLAHSVMLEFAAIALSLKYKSFGSYKSSSNPVLDWMIARSRCRFVDFVVSRDEGLRPLIRAIKRQRIMIFLPDEDLGLDNAVFAPFFGRLKATLTTPSRITHMSGAKAVAGFVAFDKTSAKYKLRLHSLPLQYPENKAEVDAVSLNHVLEKLILQNPDQYMWLMKCYRTNAPNDERFY